MPDCARCSKGPEGLEGHLELAIHHDDQPRYGAGQGRHVFICITCAAKWDRRYEGGGLFVWQQRGGGSG